MTSPRWGVGWGINKTHKSSDRRCDSQYESSESDRDACYCYRIFEPLAGQMGSTGNVQEAAYWSYSWSFQLSFECFAAHCRPKSYFTVPPSPPLFPCILCAKIVDFWCLQMCPRWGKKCRWVDLVRWAAAWLLAVGLSLGEWQHGSKIAKASLTSQCNWTSADKHFRHPQCCMGSITWAFRHSTHISPHPPGGRK